MFELLIGLFITALLNGIWSSRGDPERYQQYWSKETANVYQQLDSAIFADVYEFDSVVYFSGDAAAIRNKQRTNISDSTVLISNTLRLDGL